MVESVALAWHPSALLFVTDRVSLYFYAVIYLLSYFFLGGEKHLISHIGLDYLGLFASALLVL